MQLLIEDVPKRKQTAELLARMFSAQGSQLIVQHKSLWQAYLKRHVDLEPKVRIVLAENVGAFLVHQPEASEEITKIAKMCVIDNHETVRVAAIQTIFATASKFPHAVDSQLIEIAFDRRLDKKESVRDAALVGGSTFLHAISQGAEDWAFGTNVPRHVHSADDMARCVIRSMHIKEAETQMSVINLFNQHIMSSDLS